MMLPDTCKEWILSVIPNAKEIKCVTPLLGGMSSFICKIDVTTLYDAEQNYVLRMIREHDWLNEDEGVLEQEALMLQHIEKDVGDQSKGEIASYPRLVAYDSTGEKAGLPVTLMTYIDGKVTLPLEPTTKWLEQLAKGIAPLHQATQGIEQYPYSYSIYSNLDEPHPALKWSAHPEKWKIAIEYVKSGKPSYKPSLIHRDYHPTNVMWNNDGYVVGVVDWINGCMGPVGIDIGHCRINLVELYGVAISNQFLESYLSLNQDFVYDPYWDICCLFDMTSFGEIDVYEGWTALGYDVLTPDIIMKRIDEYIDDLVQLLHHNRYNRNT